MLKTYLYIIFLFVALPGLAKMHNRKADSLKMLLQPALENQNTVDDTATINKINKLAAEYTSSYPDSTLYYGQLAINKSRTINYSKGIADGLKLTASVYFSKANYTAAKQNLNEAIGIYQVLNDQQGISDSYKVFGDLYIQTGEYQKSLYYFNSAYAIKTKLNDQPGIAGIYLHMGNVYNYIGHPSTGLDYYFKSLNIDIKLHNRAAAAAAYNNIGLILQDMEIYPKALDYYRNALKTFRETRRFGGISAVAQNIGEVLMIQGNYKGAIKYLTEAMAIAQKADDKDGISSLYNDLGLCFAHQGQYKNGLSYIDESLHMATAAHIDLNQAVALTSFAMVYNMQGHYAQAYQYAVKAKQSADKLGSLAKRGAAILELSTALGGLKKFDEAYRTQKLYIALKDSLKSDESIQKFTSYNLESDFEQKQQRQQLLQNEKDSRLQQRIQKQRLVSTIFLVIILGMVFVLVVYYNARQKQQKVNAKLEEKNHEVSKQKTDIDEQAFKLNELNNLKDRLISILAHDLRAPLSTLRGLFSLLQDATLSQQEVLEMIPQVLRKLEYTSDFLDTLLFWINSQMDNFEGSAKNFAIKDIASSEINNNQEYAHAKGIILLDHVPKTLIASADPSSIRIVIRNLITNAIKFSRKGDEIIVTASQRDENNLLISVQDTGIGMPAEQLQKLFKSKVNSGTGTNNESGTGMGLLFCKDLIEKSNGIIWATSKLGVGTEFFFTLPLSTVSNKKMELA